MSSVKSQGNSLPQLVNKLGRLICEDTKCEEQVICEVQRRLKMHER